MVEYTRIKKFAENSPALYEAMKIYGEHCLAERGVVGKQFADKSKDVMESAINKEFMEELCRRTGMNPEDNFDGSLKRFANNAQVMQMADDIRDYMIDMLLPETLLTGSLRYFADFRFADLGDSMSFDIENNALYNVTKAISSSIVRVSYLFQWKYIITIESLEVTKLYILVIKQISIVSISRQYILKCYRRTNNDSLSALIVSSNLFAQ